MTTPLLVLSSPHPLDPAARSISLRAAKRFIDLGLRPLSRALFEGFLLNFHTLLHGPCRASMWTFLLHSLGVEGGKKALGVPPSRPGGKKFAPSDWELVGHTLWGPHSPCGSLDPLPLARSSLTR